MKSISLQLLISIMKKEKTNENLPKMNKDRCDHISQLIHIRITRPDREGNRYSNRKYKQIINSYTQITINKQYFGSQCLVSHFFSLNKQQ